MAKMGQPIRIALTGMRQSPGVFDLLMLLGMRESVDRMGTLIDKLKG